MKLLFSTIFLFAFSGLLAQNVPYNVVFDLTSKDTNDHKMVMRWLTGISKERPEAKMDLVLYGQSLDLIRRDKSVGAKTLHQLMQNKNINIKVCAASMKRQNISSSELLPGVLIVPDGIYEIITRQKEGWGYIKAGH